MTVVRTKNPIAGRAEARRSVVISTGTEPFVVAAVNEEGEIILTFTLPVGMTKKFSEYVDIVPEAAFFEAQGGLFVFRGVSETIRTKGHRNTAANPLYEQPRLDMQMLLMQQEFAKLRKTVEILRADPSARPPKRAVTRDQLKEEEVITDEAENIEAKQEPDATSAEKTAESGADEKAES